MLFPTSYRCSVGGETIRLSSQSSRVQYSAPLFFFSFFFFHGGWCLLYWYVCFCLFCNTPPTCDHHLRLGLCWAIAMHKSHGQTLDKVVIDLGPKEACTGLHSSLSRAKRLVDLMVEPMSCLLYTSPSPRDGLLSRMPSSA